MPPSDSALSPSDLRAALALAQAILPGTARIPGAGPDLVERSEALVREFSGSLVRPWVLLQRTLDVAAVAAAGRPFHQLPPEQRDELIRTWEAGPLRTPLALAALVYKLVHFDQPRVYDAMGGRERGPVQGLERPRWLEQIHPAQSFPDDALECDVVVVGTGAGGAVVGKELAERGHAVVFVEKGEHHRRDAFLNSSLDAHRRFYKAALAVGNAVVPVFMGQLVGGSTAINGGTCFETPPWVLDEWCESLGTDEFAPDRMAPLFARVAQVAEIAESTPPEVGPLRTIFERGTKALGWHHVRIRRNVVGCTASGFCDFGCRTDARRSTNLSYVPKALERGALLLTGAAADRIIVENGRATGVEAVDARGRRLVVRAKAVVLAAGAIPTPLLLLKQGLCNGSDQVGRNLSVQPSAGVSALFDDEIRPHKHIPQADACDEFGRDGELIIAAGPEVNVAAQLFPVSGRRLMDLLERMPHIGSIGALIRDDGVNGRVWREVGGQVAVSYFLGERLRKRVHSTMLHAAEMFVAAGAKRLYLACTSRPVVELSQLDDWRENPPPIADLPMVAYHPLGTCRMGKDPRTSVVGIDHQAHEVRRLYVVDASTLPGALGVNPQLTIMAMATRAAELIHDAL